MIALGLAAVLLRHYVLPNGLHKVRYHGLAGERSREYHGNMDRPKPQQSEPFGQLTEVRSTLTDWAAVLTSAMSRELLRSEWRRVILATGTALLMVVLTVVAGFTSDEASPMFRARMTRGFVILLVLLIYEAGVMWWLSRRLKSGRPSPRAFRYLNTIIEVSIPTAAMLLLGARIGFMQVLAGGAPFLYFVLIVLSALYLDFWLCVTAGAGAAAGFGALVLLSMGGQKPVPGWEILTSPTTYGFKMVALLLAGLATGLVAAQIRRQMIASVSTTAERDRAISIFGQHVSPQVAEMLLHQPIDFAGEERNVCVMFLDIRGFSRLAADRSPSEIMDYLNTLFSPMIDLVNRHRGIVNKFLGDGFMAVFGAPVDDAEQCQHAVQAAKKIMGTVEQLNREGRIPPTRIGIGLHMGQAVTGNVGSTERKEYTIIGDVVNLASRIEQATKQLGGTILISEVVEEKLDPVEHPAEDLGHVDLRGQNKPVRLYRVA